MAVLTDPDRVVVWRGYMTDLSQVRETATGLTKADIRAAVDAIDTFLNTNATALNTAIPLPARTSLTTAQKARLLVAVVTRRYITGV